MSFSLDVINSNLFYLQIWRLQHLRPTETLWSPTLHLISILSIIIFTIIRATTQQCPWGTLKILSTTTQTVPVATKTIKTTEGDRITNIPLTLKAGSRQRTIITKWMVYTVMVGRLEARQQRAPAACDSKPWRRDNDATLPGILITQTYIDICVSLLIHSLHKSMLKTFFKVIDGNIIMSCSIF